jgi:phosphatidylserine synthase
MVSNVRYRNFKDLKKGKKPLVILSVLTGILIILAIMYRPTFAILSFFCGYLLMGLADEVVTYTKRKPDAPSENETETP